MVFTARPLLGLTLAPNSPACATARFVEKIFRFFCYTDAVWSFSVRRNHSLSSVKPLMSVNTCFGETKKRSYHLDFTQWTFHSAYSKWLIAHQARKLSQLELDIPTTNLQLKTACVSLQYVFRAWAYLTVFQIAVSPIGRGKSCCSAFQPCYPCLWLQRFLSPAIMMEFSIDPQTLYIRHSSQMFRHCIRFYCAKSKRATFESAIFCEFYARA